MQNADQLGIISDIDIKTGFIWQCQRETRSLNSDYNHDGPVQLQVDIHAGPSRVHRVRQIIPALMVVFQEWGNGRSK